MEFGILSIVPPIVAIIMAIITRQTIISLSVGIILGEFIVIGGGIGASVQASIGDVIAVFAAGWMTKTIFFSFLVGAIITLIQVSGGVEGFVEYLTEKSGKVKSKRSAMFLAYIIGIVIFIESSI